MTPAIRKLVEAARSRASTPCPECGRRVACEVERSHSKGCECIGCSGAACFGANTAGCYRARRIRREEADGAKWAASLSDKYSGADVIDAPPTGRVRDATASDEERARAFIEAHGIVMDQPAADEELPRELAALLATVRAEAEAATVERVAAWLVQYADECSGSHPANSGHIALNAAANRLRSGAWKVGG